MVAATKLRSFTLREAKFKSYCLTAVRVNEHLDIEQRFYQELSIADVRYVRLR